MFFGIFSPCRDRPQVLSSPEQVQKAQVLCLCLCVCFYLVLVFAFVLIFVFVFTNLSNNFGETRARTKGTCSGAVNVPADTFPRNIRLLPLFARGLMSGYRW